MNFVTRFTVPIILCYLILCTAGQAQQLKVSGNILDSLSQHPLAFANIIAQPVSEEDQAAFAISDESGRFSLNLRKGGNYLITASYLGYQKRSVFLYGDLKEDRSLDFQLIPIIKDLDEVIVIEKGPPIIVKRDTIIYEAEVFASGDERKLKEVLKKLPGVEVDRNGSVFVNGERVDKLLVEGRPFFGGNSKLAVNHIPADAVNKVEVLQDYNEIVFLKGLSGEQEVAMNIKLKEDKKNFAFGDVKAGTNFENRYLFHPNLFYYSPKTNINFIGDVNNAGIAPFTFADYLAFEGGASRLMKNTASIFNGLQNEFESLLIGKDFYVGKDKFAALDHSYRINPKLGISSYALFSGSAIESRFSRVNNYFVGDQLSVTERRDTWETTESTLGLAKIALDFQPTEKEFFSYQVSGKISGVSNPVLNRTKSLSSQNDILSHAKTHALRVSQSVEWHKQNTKAHTSSFSFDHQYSERLPETQWQSENPILPGLIPYVEDSTYHILQFRKTEVNQLNALYKHYWIINNDNHIYTTLGNSYSRQGFKSLETQALSNGFLKPLSEDFGNDLRFGLNDIFIGIHHKFQKGNLELEYGLTTHQYHWKGIQKQSFRKATMVLLPAIRANIEIKNIGKIKIDYKLKSFFPDASNFVDNFYLKNFNTLFRGNADLQNELSHVLNIHYSRFDFLTRTTFNGNFSFERKINNIQNQVILSDINQFYFPVLVKVPDFRWRFRGGFAKDLTSIKFSSRLLTNYFYQKQQINGQGVNTRRLDFTAGISLETKFDNLPNLEMGYNQRMNYYFMGSGVSTFTINEPLLNVNYRFFSDFVLKAEYTGSIFRRTKAAPLYFNTANASLYYQEEDHPLGFEIEVKNLFDVSEKVESFFSSFLVSESRTYLMERLILLSISYTL